MTIAVPAPERRANPALGLASGARRYFDAALGAYVIKVLPGDFAVGTAADELLVTVLGSCVSACIRDRALGIGGMNHFMLSGGIAQPDVTQVSEALRYGHFAMEKLLNEMYVRGAQRKQLEIKLFGGASVIESSMDIGAANISFVRGFLRDENLPIDAEDLGGTLPRRIHFNPVSGKVQQLYLRRQNDSAVYDDENTYRHHLVQRLKQEAHAGEVELFT